MGAEGSTWPRRPPKPLLPLQRFAVSRIAYWARESCVALLCDR